MAEDRTLWGRRRLKRRLEWVVAEMGFGELITRMGDVGGLRDGALRYAIGDCMLGPVTREQSYKGSWWVRTPPGSA